MVRGGGNPVPLPAVLMRAAAMAGGLPADGAWGWAALLVVAALVAGGTYVLLRSRDPDWIFFPAILVVAPLALLAVTGTETVYFRYFIIALPFFYLLAARLAGFILRSGPHWARALVVVALAGYLAGQGCRLVPLLHRGRGSYRAAVRTMAARTPAGPIRVGSDHDFRTEMLLRFHGRNLPAGRLQYIPREAWLAGPPRWLLTHSQDRSHQPPARLEFPPGLRYELVDTFPYGGVSGWSWYLYRTTEAAPQMLEPRRMSRAHQW